MKTVLSSNLWLSSILYLANIWRLHASLTLTQSPTDKLWFLVHTFLAVIHSILDILRRPYCRRNIKSSKKNSAKNLETEATKDIYSKFHLLQISVAWQVLSHTKHKDKNKTKETKTHINNNELWPSLILGIMVFCTRMTTTRIHNIFTPDTTMNHSRKRYTFIHAFFWQRQKHIIGCWSWIGDQNLAKNSMGVRHI